MTASSQEKNLYHMHGVVLPKAQHKQVRRIKRQGKEPSLHGNKVWRSSAVLMDYLLQYPIRKGAKVYEVGCGWGGLSCFLSKQFNARVTALDADEALAPYVELVTELNEAKRVNFVTKRFEKITKKELAGVHTLVGSDICFWDELTGVLFNLIKRAGKAGVKQVLIADPGRTPFLHLIDRCEEKFDTEMIAHSISTPWKSEKFILKVTFR